MNSSGELCNRHIKIKRNNFFEGFVGYQTVALLMKCVQEKIFATEESGRKSFFICCKNFQRESRF